MRKEVKDNPDDRLADSYSDIDLQQGDTTIITADAERRNNDETNTNAAYSPNIQSKIEYITQNGDQNTFNGGAYVTKSSVESGAQNNGENRQSMNGFVTSTDYDANIYKSNSYYQFGNILENQNNPKRWENYQYNDDLYNALMDGGYRFDQKNEPAQIIPNAAMYVSDTNGGKIDSDVAKRSDKMTELDNNDGRKRVMVVKKKSESSYSAAEHAPETFIKSSYDNFESPSSDGFNLYPNGERYHDPWSQRTFWLLLIMLMMNSAGILFCIYGQRLEKKKRKKEQKRKSQRMKHILHSASFGSRENINIATDSDPDDETDDEFAE